MSVHFEQEIDLLKQKLLAMAGHAEAAVSRAMQALVQRNDALAVEVEKSDHILDRCEMDIDEFSIRLLAKAPLASELRMITIAMKISHDLERVGDEATKISRRVLGLNEQPQLKPYVDLPRMADLALEMLRTALQSFVRKDSAAARAIIPRDKEVDGLNKQLHRELVGFMLENPQTVTRALDLMVIAKSLERIADHAKNVAEEVVFLLEGRDIRHPGASR